MTTPHRCGRDSVADGFLVDGDYGDCYPCLDCQDDRDVETPMSFRLTFQRSPPWAAYPQHPDCFRICALR
jgi:hypothetical protein